MDAIVNKGTLASSPLDQRKLKEVLDHYSKISGNVLKEDVFLGKLNQRSSKLRIAPEIYLDTLLKKDPVEEKAFLSMLTVHHTFFFRENRHFEYLREHMPLLLMGKEKKGDYTVKVWSAACSRGQEVYSLAMCMEEILKAYPKFKYQILGTDIDQESVLIAQNGVYPFRETSGISRERLQQFWQRGKGKFKDFVRVKKGLTGNCSFKSFNLISGDFNQLGKFDFIFCRNVFIYFTPDVVDRISNKMLNILERGGLLFTGLSESLGSDTNSRKRVGGSIYSVADNDLIQKIAPIQEEPKIKAKKKVLIVDDSVSIRKLLKRMIEPSKTLTVIGEANDPIEAQELIKKERPDLVTLDIHMPNMDGVTFLKQHLSPMGIPTVMISSVSMNEGGQVIEALGSGALSYIEKPNLADFAERKADYLENLEALVESSSFNTQKGSKYQIGSSDKFHFTNPEGLFVIGSSTGGTHAVEKILHQFSGNIPPTIIVQHIPEKFSEAFASRLNGLFDFEVKEAKDGESVKSGVVYIAPGGKQLKIKKSGASLSLEVNDDEPVNRFKPSVDYFFNSLVSIGYKKKIVAAILTGMGKDGAQGLYNLKAQGAKTVVQDEKTSVVFGMPKEAIRLGAADKVLPIDEIPSFIFKEFE